MAGKRHGGSCWDPAPKWPRDLGGCVFSHGGLQTQKEPSIDEKGQESIFKDLLSKHWSLRRPGLLRLIPKSSATVRLGKKQAS